MSRVRHFFLRANHWQMCLLFAVVSIIAPFVGQIAIISATAASSGTAREQVLGTGLLALISEGVLLSWLWIIGSFLGSVVPPELRPRQSFYRVAIIFPLLFTFVALAVIVSNNSWPIALTLSAGIFAFSCLLYDFNFVARTLYLAETGEPPMMGDTSLTILQLWFFPVGAWFIQPRVNRLYSETETSNRSAKRRRH
jgi:hypothetical protein